MPNFRGDKDLCKLGKEYLNNLLCNFGIFCLQHSKTFDISHAFLRETVAELSTPKHVRFFGPPCRCRVFYSKFLHSVCVAWCVTVTNWTGDRKVPGSTPSLGTVR